MALYLCDKVLSKACQKILISLDRQVNVGVLASYFYGNNLPFVRSLWSYCRCGKIVERISLVLLA